MAKANNAYIEAWQARSEAARTVPFKVIRCGMPFTLPGGLMRQIKLNEGQAGAGQRIFKYDPDEPVVPLTLERYLLLREEGCPACGGDGWKIDDDEPGCPECDGQGWRVVQVAVVPSSVAGVLVVQFGQDC